MPPDLMYDDSYVQAVYNPQPQVARPAGPGFLHGLFRFLLIVAVILAVMWLVFARPWRSWVAPRDASELVGGTEPQEELVHDAER